MSLDCDSLSASTNRSGFDQSVHTFARNISSVEIQADHAAHAGFWILLELSFFGIQRLRYRKFNRPNRNVPRTHLNDIKQRFDDFLTLSSVLNLREFLSGWFLGIASEDIFEDNVSDFLSYAYWFQPFQELSEEDQATVKSFNQKLQDSFNVQFPKGNNPDLQLMQHLWEPLRVVHKPLMLHLISEMSTFCTHLLLQALRFERYEFMGFTYWAHGLHPPQPEEVPDGARRLTALQSMFVDLHSLLNSDDQGGPGPMDFLSAQAQGIADYQKRLQATLHDVMMPPSFEDSFTDDAPANVLPNITATLAAFSEYLPSVPMPQLPRLPSMTPREGGPPASTGGISLPKVLSLPSLVPTFQSGLSDLARDSFGNFEELESLANGIPNLTRNVRQTVSELSSQATAVRGALMAALPVLNLPDWGLGMTTEPGEDSASRPAPTWQERLGAAVTTVVQHMELDTLFANVFQDSFLNGEASHYSEATSARTSGKLSWPPSGPLPDSSHSQPAAAAATTVLEEWFQSASRAARGGHGIIARFSGFSMPAPSQLLPPSLSRPLWTAFGLRGGSQRLAGANPASAAALRRAVEGSVLQRSAGAHRSNPDLFAMSPSAPTATTAPTQRMPAQLSSMPRLQLRLQELRDADGNRFCRSVHVTSGRSAGLGSRPSAATLAQPDSARSSAYTVQLSHRNSSLAVEGNTGSIDNDMQFADANEGDTGMKCGSPAHTKPSSVERLPLESPQEDPHKSFGCANEGSAPLSSHPCVHTYVDEHSAFERASVPRSASVTAHPVEAEPPVSGHNTSRSLVQTNRNNSVQSSSCSDVHATLMQPGTPSSTAGTAAHSQGTLSSLEDHADTVPCHDNAPEAHQQREPEVSTDAGHGASVSRRHAGKPPLPVPAGSTGKLGRQKPVQQNKDAGQKESVQKQPLVFLHGVGFGVLPYLGMVWKLLRAFPDRPFVLLEVRHVSLRLCMHAVGVDDVVRVLSGVLQRHGITQAHLIGHSFGTFVVAHMRKLFPEAVSSVLLCDPVCMLTCFPKLLYNFIYRGVHLGDLLEDPVEMARWLVARDLCIASTFCRHFFWHTLMLWPWELPDCSVLVLSTKDALVPSELVKKQLEAGLKGGRAQKVRVLEKSLHHGHFLFYPQWQETIIKTYKDAVDEAEAVLEARVHRHRRSNSGTEKRNGKLAQTSRAAKTEEAISGVVGA